MKFDDFDDFFIYFPITSRGVTSEWRQQSEIKGNVSTDVRLILIYNVNQFKPYTLVYLGLSHIYGTSSVRLYCMFMAFSRHLWGYVRSIIYAIVSIQSYRRYP